MDLREVGWSAWTGTFYFLFSVAQLPRSGRGRLIFEVSRSHTITHTHAHTYSAGLL